MLVVNVVQPPCGGKTGGYTTVTRCDQLPPNTRTALVLEHEIALSSHEAKAIRDLHAEREGFVGVGWGMRGVGPIVSVCMCMCMCICCVCVGDEHI